MAEYVGKYAAVRSLGAASQIDRSLATALELFTNDQVFTGHLSFSIAQQMRPGGIVTLALGGWHAG
jgi:hypothetical protein